MSVGESSSLASATEDRQTKRVDMTRKAKKRVLGEREEMKAESQLVYSRIFQVSCQKSRGGMIPLLFIFKFSIHTSKIPRRS